jgi:hypothetical protein
MTTVDKINKLKEKGKVSIKHYRLTEEGELVLTYRNNMFKFLHGVKPPVSNKGGVSQAIFEPDDMVVTIASSRCSKNDNFNYKVGAGLAVDRLFNQIFPV